MILFLRDKNNNTLLDIDVWIEKEKDYKYIELSSLVDIYYYSNMLLEINDDIKKEFINDFYALSELRGWLWEVFFMGGKNDISKYDDVISSLEKILIDISNKYNLTLIKD